MEAVKYGVKASSMYHVQAFAHFHADGSRCHVPHDQCPLDHTTPVLLWEVNVPNLVTTAGLNKLLDATLKTGLTGPTWYVGLVDNASFSAYNAADTMGSHAGWLESAAYSNANRPTYTPGTISGGSVDNSASKAVFNINATATIRGAFMADNNTKSGTTGTLYGEADFSGGSRAVVSGDTLNVTVTATVS